MVIYPDFFQRMLVFFRSLGSIPPRMRKEAANEGFDWELPPIIAEIKLLVLTGILGGG